MPQKCPFPSAGICNLRLIQYVVHGAHPIGTSIGSAVYAGLTTVATKQTCRQTGLRITLFRLQQYSAFRAVHAMQLKINEQRISSPQISG